MLGQGSEEDAFGITEADGARETFGEQPEAVVHDRTVEVNPSVIRVVRVGQLEELTHLRGVRAIGSLDDERTRVLEIAEDLVEPRAHLPVGLALHMGLDHFAEDVGERLVERSGLVLVHEVG
jgi:hypothetical protein